MTQILLIEDRKKLSQELSTVLQFLGEQPLHVTRAYWLEKGITGDGLGRAKATAGDPAQETGASDGAAPDTDVGESSADSSGGSGSFRLALIGQYKPALLVPLLEAIVARHEGLPVVLLGDKSPPDLPPHLRSVVVAILPMPLSYQPMLDALHKAQVYADHFRRLRDIGTVRDYNMFPSLVGESPPVQQVRQLMSQVAHTEVTVLITGESGTGKEVVARNLHANSARADKPFVPINCGAIPPDLLESELFGHEKGAFTGAISTRIGRFELAEGGTLFLDEIGDMPLPMQVKLLRVLQEQCFERVGGTRTLQTDVRILAATHRDLEEMINQGSFRQDLYYRLNVFPIEMPALRERATDIPFLLNELITRLETANRGSVRFNTAAIDALSRYPWPGNVRELANLVERMAIMYPHSVVGLKDLPEQYREQAREGEPTERVAASAMDGTAASNAVTGARSSRVEADEYAALMGEDEAPAAPALGAELLPVSGLDLREYLANLEKSLIEQALSDCGGVVARAADRLGIRRTTLVEKMRKYEMQR